MSDTGMQNRKTLNSTLKKMGTTQPFPTALQVFNKQLMKWGNTDFTSGDLKHYTDLSEQVEKRKVSNSFGFGSSMVHWAKRGKLGGVGMNFLGFLGAGAYDHTQWKLGRGGIRED